MEISGGFSQAIQGYKPFVSSFSNKDTIISIRMRLLIMNAHQK